jgi:molybdopterin/thiamine biosynthesis adenylyltransferase/rhodanese-related sulfurtransferase
VGAGGLGSPAALYLAASGVGTIGIVDCDRVDASNLQRQVLFDKESVTQPKADAARRRLLALNPEITVKAHATELRAANAMELLAGYDVVLDGTDRIATRYVVNDACVLLSRPLVSAAIHRFEGQVMTYRPGLGPCYRCLYPEVPEGLVANCADAGVLGVLPGVVGAIQATEAIKLIVGAGSPLVGRLLVYDALDMVFREFDFAQRRDCAVCGDHPTIKAPADATSAACDVESDGDRFASIGPAQLRAWLDQTGPESDRRSIRLVDVREPREFAAGHLGHSVNIPLAELSDRIVEIPHAARIVFICRSGARSRTACRLAVRAGLTQVSNLDGGLLAWAAEIDPAFTVASAR